jgi:Xaa-Pro aminopeptidase
MPIPTIPVSEYRSRRARIFETLGDGEVALLQGGPLQRSHDRFRQTNDFRYLCNAEVPHAYLLLDGRDGTTHLFLPSRPHSGSSREEPLLGSHDPEAAMAATGVDAVHPLAALTTSLERVGEIATPLRQGAGAFASWDTLQRSQQERFGDPWDGRPDRMRWFVQLLRERCPAAEIRDLAPTLDKLRLIKSESEIELMRRSGSLSAHGIVAAMRATKPGAVEYHLDAAMRYVYLSHGARDAAYRAIVAGGDNAWYGHYAANDAVLVDGDLVLVDCAPDYGYYASDIGRMWPVNGRYSDVQRELYGFIVRYHQVLLDQLKPGITDDEVLRRSSEIMREVVETTTFSKQIYREAAERTLVFRHLTHPVGLAVHDVGHYRHGILEPGVVLTVDPQFIVPEERLYIRVEDTVVITEDGIENFTAPAPLDLDEVEACMRDEGLLERFPADLFD